MVVPNDISQSLGMPDEVRNPQVETALREAAARARGSCERPADGFV